MAKSSPKEPKEFNWQLNFYTALEDEDKHEDLVGSVDQKIYSSYSALTFMFWWKSFIGQQISDAEMRFIRKAAKRHISLVDNPNLPNSILEQLAKNTDEGVRWGVANNPNTPIPVLEQLAKDENRYVRTGVANNPNTPIPVFEQMAKNTDEIVREHAEARAEHDARGARGDRDGVRLGEQLAEADGFLRGGGLLCVGGGE
jgi:hypothetical protein